MAALAGSTLLPSCGGGGNSLTGSLDEISPLTFDSVVVRASPDVLVVEYDNHPLGTVDGGASGGTDVAFKIAINIDGLTLNKGLDIDLTSALNDGTPRVACTRAVGQDPRRDLPPVARGDLVLDSDVNYDANASGHFHVLFAEGGQIGEGRTVDGTFSAVVQNADPGSTQ
ncbi:MAG: hypothetical protein JST54_25725 [Deltaproteobacteria bacterium]|nr:hypothetical protein [Deltaproteobacteria bacterium]